MKFCGFSLMFTAINKIPQIFCGECCFVGEISL